MSDTIGTMFGFLGGTIVSVEEGYRVLEHRNPHRIYQRLSEAKWFLALRWCEQFPSPAGILNYQGQFSFYNEASLKIGAENFVPFAHRQAIFNQCLCLQQGKPSTYSISSCDGQSSYLVEILGIDIDPRFGRVVLVRKL